MEHVRNKSNLLIPDDSRLYLKISWSHREHSKKTTKSWFLKQKFLIFFAEKAEVGEFILNIDEYIGRYECMMPFPSAELYNRLHPFCSIYFNLDVIQSGIIWDLNLELVSLCECLCLSVENKCKRISSFIKLMVISIKNYSTNQQIYISDHLG